MITEQQFASNSFQHCSTISSGPPGSGTFLAYYTGDAECHPTQHVEICWFDENGVPANPVQLEALTGNPILVETIQVTFIIYSKFEDTSGPRMEWWQHCSLWVSSLDVKWNYPPIYGLPKPQITVGAPKQIIIEEPGDEPKPPTGLGYLPRCHPTWTPDGYLLPLYREHAPHFHGVILHSTNGLDWKYRGSIGKGEAPCIQPTIWRNQKDNKLCSLSRHFSRSGKLLAYYSESADEGTTWSPLTYSKYDNCNNSIVAINGSKDQTLVVWNQDPAGRNNISLGSFDLKNPQLISTLDGHGSYPSICINGKFLKIAYTAKANPLKMPKVRTIIKVKTYNLEAVIKSCRKDTTWEGFSQIYSS
jgi:hypothetical protein